MSDTIELIVSVTPSAVTLDQTASASVTVSQAEQITVELGLAPIGPAGAKGDPGPSVDLDPIIGNPETDLALLYSILKL